jgi:hypothetical protein
MCGEHPLRRVLSSAHASRRDPEGKRSERPAVGRLASASASVWPAPAPGRDRSRRTAERESGVLSPGISPHPRRELLETAICSVETLRAGALLRRGRLDGGGFELASAVSRRRATGVEAVVDQLLVKRTASPEHSLRRCSICGHSAAWLLPDLAQRDVETRSARWWVATWAASRWRIASRSPPLAVADGGDPPVSNAAPAARAASGRHEQPRHSAAARARGRDGSVALDPAQRAQLRPARRASIGWCASTCRGSAREGGPPSRSAVADRGAISVGRPSRRPRAYGRVAFARSAPARRRGSRRDIASTSRPSNRGGQREREQPRRAARGP